MARSDLARTGPAPTTTGLLLGALVVPGALGVSTVAVALPSLSDDVGLSHPQAAWILAGYVLAQAMFVAVFGRLGDIRGMRAVVAAGAALTGAGSLVAAISDAFAPLLLGRLLQGAGGGALQVASYGILAAHFAGRDRAKALGVLTACLGIVSGSGTLIGGLLTDAASWRIAAATPALALLAIGAALRLAPAAATARTRLDALGAVLVAAVASALVLLLETPSIDFATWVLVAVAAVAVAATVALVLRVRAVPDGFVPAAVVRSTRYVLGALATLSLMAGYLGMLFAAPLLLLQDHDWSPTQIGLVLWPAALMGAVSARVVARLIATRDPFRLTAGLAVVNAAGLIVGGIADGAPGATALALGLILVGFSGGQVALIARVPLMVEPEFRSVATGLFTLVFVLGGAIGSAAVAGLSDPLGLSGAVAALAVLPATGAALALAAGAAPRAGAARAVASGTS